MREGDAPVRAPSATPVDDAVLPFEVSSLDVRGRLVRLGPLLDAILNQHQYPVPVSKLLGEAIALTALLGSSLKFDGRFILQTQSDGPVPMIVVDYRSPDRIRAYARYDEARMVPGMTSGALMGRGHLAMTIDQGAQMSRYQGLVALEGEGLEQAAHEYFLRSEQIPTRVRLAVGEELRAGEGAHPHWRAGGIMLQFLPESEDRRRQADLDPGDAPEGAIKHDLPDDDAWVEAQALIETVEDVELIDPSLSGERLVYRLFHERGVRVFDTLPVRAQCSCSRDAVTTMLKRFSAQDRADMVNDGKIVVTCEFCSASYSYDPAEVETQVAAQDETQDEADNSGNGAAASPRE